MTTSGWLAVISVVVSVGAVAAYVRLLHVVRWFSVSRNLQVRPDPDDVLRAVRAIH